MGHVPHLYLPGPWEGSHLAFRPEQAHHLERVLRVKDGSEVSYTDGRGLTGTGIKQDGAVERGAERLDPPPRPTLSIATPPPEQKDRARFLVEKLGELGVARLIWLRTERSEGRVPSHEKSMAWARSALEQSRGSYLMQIEGPFTLDLLDPPLMVADESVEVSSPLAGERLTIAIGPEGGWSPEEIPASAPRLALGRRVLRLETAAIAAAAIFMVTGGAN